MHSANQFAFLVMILDNSRNGPRTLIEDPCKVRRVHLNSLEFARLTWEERPGVVAVVDPNQTAWPGDGSSIEDEVQDG